MSRTNKYKELIYTAINAFVFCFARKIFIIELDDIVKKEFFVGIQKFGI